MTLMRSLLSILLLTTVGVAQSFPPVAVWPSLPASAMSYVTTDEPDGNVFDLRGTRGDTWVFHHNWPTTSGGAHEFYGKLRLKNRTTNDLYIHHPDGTVTGPVAPGGFVYVQIATAAQPLELKPDDSAEYEVKDEHGNEEGSFSINGSAPVTASAGGEGGVVNLPFDNASAAEVART